MTFGLLDYGLSGHSLSVFLLIAYCSIQPLAAILNKPIIIINALEPAASCLWADKPVDDLARTLPSFKRLLLSVDASTCPTLLVSRRRRGLVYFTLQSSGGNADVMKTVEF